MESVASGSLEDVTRADRRAEVEIKTEVLSGLVVEIRGDSVTCPQDIPTPPKASLMNKIRDCEVGVEELTSGRTSAANGRVDVSEGTHRA